MLEKKARCDGELSSKKGGFPATESSWHKKRVRCAFWIFGVNIEKTWKNKYPQEIKVYVEIESYTNHLP